MPRITVKIDVPDVEYCYGCPMNPKYTEYCHAYSVFLDYKKINGFMEICKCPACLAACKEAEAICH